jgi:RimJ/RimL family protein N-acetyltransferase
LANTDTSIETGRLELVPLLREHAAQLFPVLSDVMLYEYTHDTPPISLAALHDRYARLESRQSPDGKEAWFNWMVRERTSARAIGYVQATVGADEADVAWVIGTPWQRRGYATEAVQAMITWLHAAGIRAFRAKINPTHVASQRVAGNVGLSPTQESEDGEDIWLCRT